MYSFPTKNSFSRRSCCRLKLRVSVDFWYGELLCFKASTWGRPISLFLLLSVIHLSAALLLAGFWFCFSHLEEAFWLHYGLLPLGPINHILLTSSKSACSTGSISQVWVCDTVSRREVKRCVWRAPEMGGVCLWMDAYLRSTCVSEGCVALVEWYIVETKKNNRREKENTNDDKSQHTVDGETEQKYVKSVKGSRQRRKTDSAWAGRREKQTVCGAGNCSKHQFPQCFITDTMRLILCSHQ